MAIVSLNCEAMTTQTRQWRFTKVEPAQAGDFVQITFSDDPDSVERYLLLSTQFEFPQDYDIQIEVDGGEWYSQLTVAAATLSRTTLTIDVSERGEHVSLVINYAANEEVFRELARLLRLMLPKLVMLR